MGESPQLFSQTNSPQSDEAHVDCIRPIEGCSLSYNDPLLEWTNLKGIAGVNTYLLTLLSLWFILRLDGWNVLFHFKNMSISQV